MKIAEIFQSVQGEGRLTGTPSIFVRASGCNLRCVYCDTRYASWEPVGTDWSVPDIVDTVAMHGVRHVVLTGGEPMLFAELIPLCQQLRGLDHHVTIETAGTLYLPVECDLMSISPKLSNSVPLHSKFPTWHVRHDRVRHAPDVIRRLIREQDYQVKFVIENRADMEEVRRYLDDLPEIRADRVMCMPQATTKEQAEAFAQWLPAACQEFGWAYCPRQHIEMFGCAPGT
jgi:7-carboxy-7-deazaguanine synthase